MRISVNNESVRNTNKKATHLEWLFFTFYSYYMPGINETVEIFLNASSYPKIPD